MGQSSSHSAQQLNGLLEAGLRDPQLGAQLLQYVFDDLAEAVIVADVRRRVILLNPSFSTLFGYEPEQVLGRTTRMIYANPWVYDEQGSERYNTGAVDKHAKYLVQYRRKDGSIFQGETIGGPIRNAEGEVIAFIGIINDVTVRESTQEVLKRLHQITSDRAFDFTRRLDAILDLGRDHFGLPIGIVSQVDAGIYRVLRSATLGDTIEPGTEFPISDTYCMHTLAANEPTAFHHVAESEIRTHPCYQRFKLESYIGTPLFVDGVRYGTLNFSSPEPSREFQGQDLELLRLFAEWIGHELARARDIDELHRAQEELRRIATTDELTRMNNRREFLARLDAEIERARRFEATLSLLMLDLDHFKVINDRFGHECGDLALRAVGDRCRETFRTIDVMGRLGGEEFAILLAETGRDGAIRAAERIRAAIETTELEYDDVCVPLTVSVGVALWCTGEDAASLLRRADEAMYRAKDSGRNRVVEDT